MTPTALHGRLPLTLTLSPEYRGEGTSTRAPAADRFPAYPVGWYLFGNSGELARGPVTKPFLGRRLVAYRAASGGVVVMDARCSHLGSDLGLGRVVGDSIECPFHAWVYGPDGRCRHIPAVADGVGAEAGIPAFACQTVYPAQELMRRESSEARVPIDREPVPPEYAEQVKRYYERLGSGE